MGSEDPSPQGVQELELALAVRKLPFAFLGLVENGSELGDLFAQRFETLEDDAGVLGDIAGLNSDRRLVLDPGKVGGKREPPLERLHALVGEPVVGSLARPAGRLL